MHLRRAKNDKLDAVLIAACAATIEQPRIEPDERLAKLAQHLTFVEQIEEDIARLKVRLEHVGDPRLRRMVVADIARLKARRSAELLRIVEGIARSRRPRPPPRSGAQRPRHRRTHRARAHHPHARDSAKSAAKRRQRWPVLRRSMTIVENTRASATSPAGVGACAARSTPRRYRQHSVGTRPWSRSTPASPRAVKPTTQPSSPVPESSSIYANTVVQRGTPWTERPLVS